MSDIIRCDNVELSKVEYSKPEKIGKSYFSSISYGENFKPFYIQTPKLKCMTNISDITDKKVPYLELEVPNGKMNIYDFLLGLDDKNIKTTVKKSKEWFGKEIPLEAIDDMYSRITKPFKKNSNPKVRFRLPIIKNEIRCGVYNQNRVFIGLDQVKEEDDVVLIIHIRGLKILKTTYYCDCYISQIKVFQETDSKFTIMQDYSIVDSDGEDIDDIFSEEILKSFETERLEQEKLEQKLEQEKLEQERLEQERLEQERLEQERFEKERLEKERLEKERLEKERLEKEKLEQEKLEKIKLLEKEREERIKKIEEEILLKKKQLE